MNPFAWLFKYFVYEPQLNALQVFYNITGDIGVSIILLALLVNLLLWPIMASSYLNSQKIRILQPKLKEIQDKNKDNQQELLKQTMEFNKKHGISNGSIFLVIIVQLFFASGLYFVINDVTNAVTHADKATELFNSLYPFTKNLPRTSFSAIAFGYLKITDSVNSFPNILLPLVNAFFSYLYGMYTFKWAPQPKLPVVKKATPDPKEKTGLDPEALQKSMAFNTIYVMPVFLFLINYSFPAGLNLYFATVGLLTLVRQITLTRYYSGHTDKLIADIADSDPQSTDNNFANDPDSLADPADLANQPVPVVDVKAVKKSSKTSKPKKAKKRF